MEYPLPRQRYKHYKGGTYEVITLATHTETGEKLKMTNPIYLGNYNYFGNRVSIMQKTITPDYCTVASNSLCNSDYTNFGNNILIGGIPAKLLKNNISRDWEGEDEHLRIHMKI